MLIPFQILDFGLFIHNGVGDGVIPSLERMAIILATVDQAEYTKAVVRQLMILRYQDKKEMLHSTISTCLSNPTLLNEEVGEISLSILCRSLQSDTYIRDIDHVSNKYRRLKELRSGSYEKLLLSENRSFARKRSKRHHVRPDDFLTLKYTEFLLDLLKRLDTNTCCKYSSDEAYLSCTAGKRFMCFEPPILVDLASIDKIHTWMARDKANYGKPYFGKLFKSLSVEQQRDFSDVLNCFKDEIGVNIELDVLAVEDEDSEDIPMPEVIRDEDLSNAESLEIDQNLSESSSDDEFPRGHLDESCVDVRNRAGHYNFDEQISESDTGHQRNMRKRERRPSRQCIEALETSSRDKTIR